MNFFTEDILKFQAWVSLAWVDKRHLDVHEIKLYFCQEVQMVKLFKDSLKIIGSIFYQTVKKFVNKNLQIKNITVN
jgi:hypothetical protein